MKNEINLMDFINNENSYNFSSTDFVILLILSHFDQPMTAAEIEELTGYKRVTVNTKLEHLQQNMLVTKLDKNENNVSKFVTYSINSKIVITDELFHQLLTLNKEQINNISPNGWRMICHCLLSDNKTCTQKELVDNYNWPSISAYKVSKALEKASIIKIDDGAYTLIFNFENNKLNQYLYIKFTESLMDSKYKHNQTDPILQIMEYYIDKETKECESPERSITNELYKLIYDADYDYYDNISSYWILFRECIHFLNVKKFPYTEALNVRGVYKNSFPDNLLHNNQKEYSKEYSLYTELKNNKLKNTKLKEPYKNLVKICKLNYSVASFMPVPDNMFNKVKGSYELTINDSKYRINDSFNLFVDAIELALENNQSIIDYYGNIINIDTLRNWKKFLSRNLQNFGLEDYIRLDKSNGRLVGIPVFSKQSLENPVPCEEEDYNEMLENTINRLENRARKLVNIVMRNCYE